MKCGVLPAVTYKGEDLLEMEPEERARAGIFMRQDLTLLSSHQFMKL